MRKIALLAAVAGVVAVGSMARADFVYSTVRTTITGTGTPLDGDDMVTLTIKQNGVGANQVGTAVSNYTGVTLSSTVATPKFFIRTFDNTDSLVAGQAGYSSTAANNVNPDLGNQATVELDGSTARPGVSASYVALGNTATDLGKFSLLASSPLEAQGGFTDYQALTTFSVDGGEPAPSGLTLGAAGKTLAVAVVPAGQEVTFAGTVYSTHLGDVPSIFSISDPVPEPTSLALAGIGAAGLLARRRRA